MAEAQPEGFAAAGRLAEWITRDEPWQYHLGPGSPQAKLCEAEGKILVLGASLNNISLLHHAEHLANVARKRVARYGLPVMRDGRRVWMDFEVYDTSRGIMDWPKRPTTEGEEHGESQLSRDSRPAERGGANQEERPWILQLI